MQSDIQASFRACISRRALRVVSYQQSRFLINFSRRSQEDEILDAVVEIIQLCPQPICRVAQRQVNGLALLALKIRVSYLESRIASVRAEIIKLFKRRRAIRVREVSHECTASPGRNADPKCAGKAIE